MPNLVRNGLGQHGVATHAASPHRISNLVQRVEVCDAARVATQDARGGARENHADLFRRGVIVDGRVGGDLLVVDIGGKEAAAE